jgi:hypothetical protein
VFILCWHHKENKTLSILERLKAKTDSWFE